MVKGNHSLKLPVKIKLKTVSIHLIWAAII